MTKISNQRAYIPDEEINGLDYLPGTDFDQALKTVNFRVQDLGTHYNQVNGVRNFDYNFYQHSGSNPKPIDGYFYSNSNEQDPNNITHFIFSKKTARLKDVSQFFESISTDNPFDLIVAQKNGINTIFFFRIDSIETFSGYYKLNVSEVFFPENNEISYTLSYAVFNLKSEGISIHNSLNGLNEGDFIHLTAEEKTKFDNLPESFATKTSDLTNDGEDGVNPFITANDLPAINFADQTETNAGTITDKVISPSTLSGFWIYVKTLAQTFAEKITFSKGVLFSPIAQPTYERGRLYFDDVNDCISYMDSIPNTSVQVGYEVLMRARNNTGATITNGSVVYISGAIGQNSTIALARANAESTSEIIGVATHDILNNTLGKVCVFGLVNDVDTSGFTDGNIVYLSASTAGILTNTPPASPNYVVSVGVIEHAHPTQGKILVKPQRALSNNNTLGTSQKLSVTENVVKTNLDLKLDKVTTIDVEKVYIKNADGTQGVKATSELGLDIFNKNNFLNWRTIKFEALGGNQSAIQSYLGSLLNTGTATTKNSTFNTSNFIDTIRRVGLVSTATAGSSIQRRLGSGVPCSTLSGFYFCSDTICSDASSVATRRFLVGLGNNFSGNIGNIEPSTNTSCIILAYDSTDSNMQIMHNDNSGTCTKIDLGVNFPARTLSTDLYRLEMVALPNSGVINYRVTRINTGHTATGTLTTNIPLTSIPLTLGFWANNGTTALAVDEAFSQITIATPH